MTTEQRTFIIYAHSEQERIKTLILAGKIGAKINLDTREGSEMWTIAFTMEPDEEFTKDESDEETASAFRTLLEEGITDIEFKMK